MYIALSPISMQMQSDSDVYFEFHSFVDFVMIFGSLQKWDATYLHFLRNNRQFTKFQTIPARLNPHICRCNAFALWPKIIIVVLCIEFSLWILTTHWTAEIRFRIIEFWRWKTCVCPSCLMNHFVQLVTHAQHCRIFIWLSHRCIWNQFFFISFIAISIKITNCNPPA